ncbi:MAG: hypothetical protein Ta2B_15570 [Termitinemataceae bacterium]|nr:MAG: hypothetical protein Ta2B_15570 [Termitinemataceae bacterium]
MGREWIKNINLTKRILEIGPLHCPNIKKAPGVNVFYADIRSTDDVKKFFYADTHVPNDQIVDIDYVIGEKYSESLANAEKFDYVIATHVLEHIPQLILFFQDIGKILNAKGKLCLAIPDKRYCFDHFRYPTSFAECYDVYTRKINNLPFRVLDFCINYTINDADYWWNNRSNFDHMRDMDQFSGGGGAKENYIKALNGEYIDVHFSVFTPETFLTLLYNMICFNLLPFKCIEFYSTDVGALEFNCVLEYEPKLLEKESMEAQKEKDNLLNLLNKYNDSIIPKRQKKSLMVSIKSLLKKIYIIRIIYMKIKNLNIK